MSDDKPKLNLRKESASSATDSAVQQDSQDVQSFLDEFDRRASAQREEYSIPKNNQPFRQYQPQNAQNRQYRQEKPAEIEEIWDDLKKRQMRDDESVFSNPEIGEIVEKIGANVAGFTSRLKAGYKKAAVKKQPDRDHNYRRVVKPAMQRGSMDVSLNSARSSAAKVDRYEPRQQQPRKMQRLIDYAQKAITYLRKPVVAGLIGVFCVVVVGNALFNSREGDQSKVVNTAVQGETTQSGSQEGGSPVAAVVGRATDFDLLFPPSLSKADTGIAIVSPPEADPVYAYNDYLEDALLSVSQQEVPETFMPDASKSFEDLAKSFAATKKIVTPKKTTVFHGYTEKNDGVQSLMFMKNDLLVFISSTEKLSDSVWSEYIDSFK